MTRKHISMLLIALALVSSIMLLRQRGKSDALNGGLTIGILQTASHPALDAVRVGFMQAIREQMPKKVKFVERNAQGNVGSAHAIAQSFHADPEIKAIFAIATPALQAIAAVEKQKPIFFAAITNPQSLGVIHPTTNVTGSSDMINIPDTISMLKELVPQVKNIALIYNNAEPNSIFLIGEMKKELDRLNIAHLDMGVTHESDMLSAVDSALHKADVLLAPTDNTVASTIDLIAQKALHAKKPLIISDNLLIDHGALAARGIDYHVHGRQAAQRFMAVFNEGKKPRELPVGYAASGRIFVNQNTLKKLSVSIPAHLEPTVVRR